MFRMYRIIKRTLFSGCILKRKTILSTLFLWKWYLEQQMKTKQKKKYSVVPGPLMSPAVMVFGWCKLTSGPYFIKVKIILSLKFKINLIFYLIKEFMKHSCLTFFYEIVNKISIKVTRNWNLKNSQRLKDDQFFLNHDFKKILTFYEIGPWSRSPHLLG